MKRDELIDRAFSKLGRVTVGGALVGSLLVNLILVFTVLGFAFFPKSQTPPPVQTDAEFKAACMPWIASKQAAADAADAAAEAKHRAAVEKAQRAPVGDEKLSLPWQHQLVK